MSELREELTRALRTVEPGQPPVEETMRRGRTIKTRRRAAIVAGALAVVAVAVGYPTLAHQLAAPVPPPAQHAHHDPVLTETPPSPGAGFGVVAQGNIGSATTWQVIVRRDTTPGSVCLTGNLMSSHHGGTTALSLGCGIQPDSGTDPASFAGTAESGVQVQLGTVAPDVAYLVLTFTDGQRLKLIPVTRFGHRYVGFAAPLNMPIASITAHLGSAHFDNGRTVTAVPFSLPGQLATVGAWRRPGQPVPPRVTVRLGSGTVGGQPWEATAYQGPWGTCVVYPGGSGCTDTPGNKTMVMGWGSSPRVTYGSAAPDVAYLKITLSDGSVLPKVIPVKVGSARLFAFASLQNRTPKHWTACSASGTPLSSGTFAG